MFDYLKENCQRIHFFGLGFIQVVVADYVRYHFYCPVKLPAFVEHPHDHRYDFRSKILKGRLKQNIFTESEDGMEEYILEYDACSPYREPPPDEKRNVFLKNILSVNHTAGDTYFIDRDTLHTVTPIGNTITRVERSTVKKDYALISTPVGEDKVCPFSQKIPEEELWEIVKEMCDGLSYQ